MPQRISPGPESPRKRILCMMVCEVFNRIPTHVFLGRNFATE